MKRITLAVGAVVTVAALASGCGGDSDDKVAIGVPAQSVATTSTTMRDSLVCIQAAKSPVPWGDEAMREPSCPSPSTATVPEEEVVCMQDDREPVCVPEEKAQQVAQERTAQSYLHYALTAERTHYTDTQKYTDDIEPLTAIESSLDWGGTIKVAVGGELDSVVCISTTSEAGTPFAVGDVAHGPLAGTYFGEECPAEIIAETVSAMGASW